MDREKIDSRNEMLFLGTRGPFSSDNHVKIYYCIVCGCRCSIQDSESNMGRKMVCKKCVAEKGSYKKAVEFLEIEERQNVEEITE